MSERVLVTGGSGFLAGHCIVELLHQGFVVRATVRSRDREPAVRAALATFGITADHPLSFVEADLTHDDGWASAVADCSYVVHVASPVITHGVRDEDQVVGPARDGTLRVLRAARDAGVRRVVLTSAFHAVGFGHPHTHGEFTEQDWSVIGNRGVDAYGRSKIIAERAAWDFVASAGGSMELSTLLPVAIMGPAIGGQPSGANEIIANCLHGKLPGFPNLYIPIVDVRDVAIAHGAALTAPDAAGERILIATGEDAMAMRQIGEILRTEFGAAAAKVPTRTIPDLVVRVAGLFRPEFRAVAADLGFVKQVSISKAVRVLDFRPRPSREAVIAAATSMMDVTIASR